MWEKGLVSIVTPTYNHARFIGACLESVQSQTYRNWEQIVVDDGSDDGTTELVRRSANEKVILVTLKHRGIEALASTYNIGLQHARGELVAVLEGDDYWPPTKLDIQVPLFDNEKTVLSWGHGTGIDATKRNVLPTRHKPRQSPVSFDRNSLLPMILWASALAPSSGILIRREVLERVGGFKQPIGASYVDLPTWLEVVLNMLSDERATYVDDLVGYWRLHPGQVTSDYDRIITSRAAIVDDFLRSAQESRKDSAWIDLEFLKEVATYYEARSAMVKGDWKSARRLVRVGLGDHSKAIRRSSLVAALSCALRRDIFRIMYYLDRQVPGMLGPRS